jgi:hypothetical protein
MKNVRPYEDPEGELPAYTERGIAVIKEIISERLSEQHYETIPNLADVQPRMKTWLDDVNGRRRQLQTSMPNA